MERELTVTLAEDVAVGDDLAIDHATGKVRKRRRDDERFAVATRAGVTGENYAMPASRASHG